MESALHEAAQSAAPALRVEAMRGLVAGSEPEVQLPDPRREATLRRGLQGPDASVQPFAQLARQRAARRGPTGP